MMSKKNLRYWCMKHPRPSRIRATVEGVVKLLEVEPRASWARVAETLHALEAELLEALNPKEEIIRACRPQDDGDEDDEDDEREVHEAEVVPRTESFDAETRRFEVVAQLVGDAYRYAAEQTGVRNDQAFNRMIDLFETVNESQRATQTALDNANRAIQRLNESQVRNALRNAAGNKGDGDGGGILEEIIEAFTSGKRGAAESDADAEAETEAPPAPNGKGPH